MTDYPIIRINGYKLPNNRGVEIDPHKDEFLLLSERHPVSFKSRPPDEAWETQAVYDGEGHIIGWDRLDRLHDCIVSIEYEPGRLMELQL